MKAKYVTASAKYNELNKDNVAKANKEKQIAFGKAKAEAAELLNQVSDTIKRITMLEKRRATEAKGKADKKKLAKLDTEVAMLKASIAKMEGERDAASEEYAKMNQEDAKKQVTARFTELA